MTQEPRYRRDHRAMLSNFLGTYRS